jgi:hypothetical protein
MPKVRWRPLPVSRWFLVLCIDATRLADELPVCSENALIGGREVVGRIEEDSLPSTPTWVGTVVNGRLAVPAEA